MHGLWIAGIEGAEIAGQVHRLEAAGSAGGERQLFQAFRSGVPEFAHDHAIPFIGRLGGGTIPCRHQISGAEHPIEPPRDQADGVRSTRQGIGPRLVLTVAPRLMGEHGIDRCPLRRRRRAGHEGRGEEEFSHIGGIARREGLDRPLPVADIGRPEPRHQRPPGCGAELIDQLPRDRAGGSPLGVARLQQINQRREGRRAAPRERFDCPLPLGGSGA